MKTAINKCGSIKLNNDSLIINDLFEVSIGGVTYGKLKSLIVKNDKMEFTIDIANNTETNSKKNKTSKK
jgi:hypothetical protein